LLFALFVLVYLWPVLLGGKMLSPIAMLYGYSPWRGSAPPDLQSYLNGLLSDIPTADYPWRYLVREMLHEGTFPSWNPRIFAGVPLYSNSQIGLFSVFNLPLWILPLNFGIGVSAAVKLWAGGFGTYLLVRQLKLGFLPGLVAGICFSFSAFNIVWLTHETLPAVALVLPWMLWLIERIYQGGRLGCALGLAVATAVALGGGHPGMQVHALAAAGTYALLRAAFLARGAPAGERLRPLGIVVGGLGLGTLLMAAMLLPEALSSRGTIGTIARSHGHGTLPGTEMPLTTIRTVLFPDWWGRPSSFEGENAPITELARGVFVGVNYNERTFFAGIVGLLLALLALVGRGDWRRKGPFAILGLLGLAIPLHLPGLYQLVTHLPVFELVQNQRMHFIWAMALSVMAAFGLQAVLDRPAGDRRRFAVMLGAVVLGIVAFIGVGASGADLSDTVEHFLEGTDFQSPKVVSLTSVGWYLLFVAGVGCALLAARRWPQRAVAIGAALVLLAAFDMLHFVNGYQPMGPESKMIPPRTESIAYLQQHRDDGRIVGLGGAVVNDWSLTYGLRDIRGYDPPQPSLRYYRLWQQGNAEQINWQSFTIEALSPEALQVVSVLGARYIVTDPGVLKPAEGGAPVEALRQVYDGADARIFENTRAAPRALVAPAVQVTANEAETRAALVDPSFDPRRVAVVERSERAAAALADSAPVHGSVRVADQSNARVVVQAELDRPGLVVLNDNWSAGWSVRIDGKPAEEVRVNDVMRGAVVGAGTHELEWRYRVPGLRAGALLSLLGLAALLAGLVVLWRRRARAER
jgi:hypothetical protein